MNGIAIEKIQNINDLGLNVNNNLNWDNHINLTLKKANQRLGYVKRTIGYRCSKDVKLLCYTTLIRPIIEYGSIIWSGVTKKQLIKIESLQRRSTKYIVNNVNMPYYDRLITCNILPLSIRREFLDCTFLYNCLHGIIDFDITNIIKMHTPHSQRNDDELQISHMSVRSELYNRFYPNRIRIIWNNIPYDVRNIDLTPLGFNTEFKRKLNQYFTNYFINNYDVDNTCTWNTKCVCRRCRLY
jgi:hypothetical protein